MSRIKKAGFVISGIGLLVMASAFTLPFIGAVAGGIGMWTAVSGGTAALAGLGTIAKIALTGAGIVGGLVVGQISAVAVNILGFAVMSGGLFKAGTDNPTMMNTGFFDAERQPVIKKAFRAQAGKPAEVVIIKERSRKDLAPKS